MQSLEIDRKRVEEDARQRVARDLRRRRIGFLGALAPLLRQPPRTNHHDAVGTEMDRRTDGRQLAHRAIAEVFAVDMHRRKHEGQRTGRHQVVER